MLSTQAHAHFLQPKGSTCNSVWFECRRAWHSPTTRKIFDICMQSFYFYRTVVCTNWEGNVIVFSLDPKPWEAIMKNLLWKVPNQQKEMKMHSQKYDIGIVYLKKKCTYVVDILSQPCLTDDMSCRQILNLSIWLAFFQYLLNQICKATYQEVCNQLKKTILQNFLSYKADLPVTIHLYFHLHNEMST